MDLHGPRSVFHSTDRRARRGRFLIEPLESRRLLSTSTSDTIITPNVVTAAAAYASASPVGISASVTNPTPAASALTPSQIAAAYNLNASATSGSGQTIAIVDAYNDPNIRADLAAFDAQYNLPSPNLTVVNQYGQTSGLPATSADWSLEIALDVEWAHAAAPGAKIVLVEASSESVTDLMTAVQTAANLANVVSLSWGGSEFHGETAYDTAAYFGKPNVTFVAASGDDGGAARAEWPAVSPYVVSVGGTTLSVTGSGSVRSETAWSASGSRWSGYSGSAGGASLYESAPSYQVSALGSSVIRRSTPDVAADANPSTGLSVYSSVSGAGPTGWSQVGGTSAASPLWAGIIAAADQARAAVGKASLSSSQTLTLLYGLYRSSSYSSDFRDITSGSNFAATARSGYDMVTGLGSPLAGTLVAASASYTGVSTNIVARTTTHVAASSTAQRTPHAEALSATLSPPLTTVTPIQAAPVALAAAPAALTSAASTVSSSAAPTSSVTVMTPPARPAQPLAQPAAESLLSDTTESTIGTSSIGTSPRAPASLEPSAVPVVVDSSRAPGVVPGTLSPSPLWDEAVDSLLEEQPALPAVAFPPAPLPLDDPEAAAASTAGIVALAGLAVAVFGTWRYRSSQTDHSRRQPAPGFDPAAR